MGSQNFIIKVAARALAAFPYVYSKITSGFKNVRGHSCDPLTGELDLTEGFGAFDAILSIYSLGNRAIDIGGGKHDDNAKYVLEKYGVRLFIYDPYMRDQEHNKMVLEEAKLHPFDACTSISVLNVITEEKERKEHIELCYSVVKDRGRVFFKIWSGNGSGIPEAQEGSFQSNRSLTTYRSEIEEVFGLGNVSIDLKAQSIVCIKSVFS